MRVAAADPEPLPGSRGKSSELHGLRHCWGLAARIVDAGSGSVLPRTSGPTPGNSALPLGSRGPAHAGTRRCDRGCDKTHTDICELSRHCREGVGTGAEVTVL